MAGELQFVRIVRNIMSGRWHMKYSMKTKQEAIDRAWIQYEYVPKPEPPEPVYNWSKCEEVK